QQACIFSRLKAHLRLAESLLLPTPGIRSQGCRANAGPSRGCRVAHGSKEAQLEYEWEAVSARRRNRLNLAPAAHWLGRCSHGRSAKRELGRGLHRRTRVLD